MLTRLEKRFAFWCIVAATAPLLSHGVVVAAPLAYVTNIYADTVSIIDTATNTVTATARVGDAVRPNALAITPDQRSVYVVNGQLRTVSVVDAATKTLTATIPLGDAPQGAMPTTIAITPDNRFAYVAPFGGTGGLAVIDVATNTVVARPALSFGTGVIFVGGIAPAPDGKRAYIIGDATSNGVFFSGYARAVLDTTTNEVTDVVRLERGASSVTVSPDGRFLYLTTTDGSTGAIVTIDTSVNTVVSETPLAAVPRSSAITPDGRLLYIAVNKPPLDDGSLGAAGEQWLDDLVRAADQALYQAKSAGRNRVSAAVAVAVPGDEH